MIVLDAFCKAGGASKGWAAAGYEVVGVDIEPQPNYPYEFYQGDAVDFIYQYGSEFDIVYGGPPCQLYSKMTKTAGTQNNHPDLIEPTRKAMKAVGRPYMIENVRGSPLENPLMLCGTMFGLLEIRHRYFECSPPIWWPPAACNHHRPVVKHGRPPDRLKHFHGITGNFSDVEWAREIRGTPWMTRGELAEAIPSQYSEWLGRQWKGILVH